MASAFGTMASAMYADTVTFKRPGSASQDDVGGSRKTPANTTPANVPCRYRPASGSEREVSGKILAGSVWMIYVPAQFSAALVDVDASCLAVIAARSGSPAEPSRTLNVRSVDRFEGLEIEITATMEG